MKEIPLLTANDIECRIQSVSENKRTGEVGAVLLLYKNARVDMRILDEVFGAENWQREHVVRKDNLFCRIGVYVAREQYGEWVWKEDVGVPSNTEAEKGEASDSFKRAGTNWGIGRELYTSPFIYVKLTEGEYYTVQANGKTVYRASTGVRFTVSDIEYNERREITGLVIKDRNGGVAYVYGSNKPKKGTTPKEDKKPAEAKREPERTVPDGILCADCNKMIQSVGKTPAELIVEGTQKTYGRPLCWECAERAKKG